MQFVTPKVFHVAHTVMLEEGVQEYLEALEIPDWVTDAPADAERLVEIMGRGCYRSFQPGMNKNVVKIRDGNRLYVDNILKTRHGSVVEHPADSYIFLDVSRVFTHELVRHRIGDAFSQESLRYVRLDDLKCWYPPAFEDLEGATKEMVKDIWIDTFTGLEKVQKRLAQILDLDNIKDFKKKKKLTSAMRRLAPIGLATMIGFSANHRAMRFIIEQRTDPAAEEEIRLVFGRVAEEQRRCYPNLYQDMIVEPADGLNWYHFASSKI